MIYRETRRFISPIAKPMNGTITKRRMISFPEAVMKETKSPIQPIAAVITLPTFVRIVLIDHTSKTDQALNETYRQAGERNDNKEKHQGIRSDEGHEASHPRDSRSDHGRNSGKNISHSVDSGLH